VKFNWGAYDSPTRYLSKKIPSGIFSLLFKQNHAKQQGVPWIDAIGGVRAHHGHDRCGKKSFYETRSVTNSELGEMQNQVTRTTIQFLPSSAKTSCFRISLASSPVTFTNNTFELFSCLLRNIQEWRSATDCFCTPASRSTCPHSFFLQRTHP